MPLAVILAPPSEVILPPELAVVEVIPEIEVVEMVDCEAGEFDSSFLQEKSRNNPNSRKMLILKGKIKRIRE